MKWPELLEYGAITQEHYKPRDYVNKVWETENITPFQHMLAVTFWLFDPCLTNFNSNDFKKGVINPRHACAVRVIVLGPCVCQHLLLHYVQQGGQKAVPIGSVPHWLDFKMAISMNSLCSKAMAWNTSCESKAAYKHYQQIESEKQSTERVVLDYTHVFT